MQRSITVRIIKNPDEQIYQEITDQVYANDGYCPCALEKNEETKCMCRAFREAGEGECHCGRFIKIQGDDKNE